MKSKTQKLIYEGGELELFAKATNWKTYWSKLILDEVKHHVLEVGAGLGNADLYLNNYKVNSWTYLEPDKRMFDLLISKKKNNSSKNKFFINGTVSNINETFFDCILYIDVLEHILDDKSELDLCTSLLNKNGKIVVLAPAHNFLYSDFDKQVGHYRRYDKESLLNLQNDNLKIKEIKYLDLFGLALNLANRFILKNKLPTSKHIFFWDKIVIPFSKCFDRLLGYRLGKSIVAVYEKL